MIPLPREHGAYGQLAFPLATALLAFGASPGALLVVTAAVAGFFAHEPASILAGLRGGRALRERRSEAVRWLAWWGAVSAAAAAAAVVAMPVAARLWLLLPVAPAILLAYAAVRGREKSWYGEVAAACAFSSIAVPTALASGATPQEASTVAVPLAVLFVTSTLAVRIVILRVRGGGDPVGAAATRRAALAVVGGGAAAVAFGVGAGLLLPAALVASTPGLVGSSLLAFRPPAPAQLRAVGWTLVALSLGTSIILVATLRS